MAFDLFSFLSKLLSGLAVGGLDARVLDWLNQKGQEYPDLKDRTDALAAFITQVVTEATPELDPATMANTIKGIAADIVHGQAGVDPASWQGGA